MAGLPWTDRELDYLREMWLAMRSDDLGAKIGRTPKAVEHMARRLGLPRKEEPKERFSKAEINLVRKFNAAGFSDVDISKLLGRSGAGVGLVRKKLGVGSNIFNHRHIAKFCRGASERSIKGGMANRAAVDRYAKEMGWPAGLHRKSIDILELLHEVGPLTRKGIRDALAILGASHSENTISIFLSELQRRGLLLAVHYYHGGPGCKRRFNLYMLPLSVQKGSYEGN